MHNGGPLLAARLALLSSAVALCGFAATVTAQHDRLWSLTPPSRPDLPAVREVAWPNNAIDRFVLARLEAQGVRHAPEADAATWLRRVSFDLIGLPPSEAELAAFLADDRPRARERVVDRLLASRHYGERQARPWLDLARYADTNGYEKDRERSIWPWRDQVIDAFNRDLPFDEFTIEQLAGDMLPEATRAQRVATGFHRNSMFNEEGGVDVEEFRYAAVIDRVNTTATTWLGLTVGCAQCHDHKYDPITQRDFFALLAIFDNCDEVVLKLDDEATTRARAKAEEGIAALRRDLRTHFPPPMPSGWTILQPTSATSTDGATMTIADDGSVTASGAAPARDEYVVEAVLDAPILAGLRVEALPDATEPTRGPGRTAHGNFVLSELRLAAGPEGSALDPIPLAWSDADFEQTGYPVAAAIDGKDDTGWGIHGGNSDWRQARAARFLAAAPQAFAGRTRVRVTLRQRFGSEHTLLRLRLALAQTDGDGDLAAQRRANLDAHFAAWLAAQRDAARPWVLTVPAAIQSAGLADFRVREDRSVDVFGNNPDRETTTLELAAPGAIAALRLEALTNNDLPGRGPGRSAFFPEAGFTISDVKARVVDRDGNARRSVAITAAAASHEHQEHPAAHAIDDAPDTGWTNDGAVGRDVSLVLGFAAPVRLADDERLEVVVAQHGIHNNNLGRFRVAVTADARPVVACRVSSELEAALAGGAPLDAATHDALLQAFVEQAPELARWQAEIAAKERALPQPPTTLVVQEREAARARQTRFHQRGEFTRPRDVVTPGVPACLPPLPSDAPADRLTFARWLVSGTHPLTARVVVNRAWAQFFGRGLVATVADFGTRGAAPSHRELLDWLACEFVADGWSLKRLHRLIVTSATYAQAAAATDAAWQADPDNVWLARMTRIRLPVELLRDAALTASGLLASKIGGPSVFPPQPEGTGGLSYGGFTWRVSEGADRYRRGLYTYQKRTAPYVLHAMFDAPSGEACLAQRARSDTPLQALSLLNDPVFVEAAQALARRVCAEHTTDDARLDAMCRRALSRVPVPAERDRMRAFLAEQRARIAAHQLDAKALAGPGDGDSTTLAPWAALARVILNLDEAITRG